MWLEHEDAHGKVGLMILKMDNLTDRAILHKEELTIWKVGKPFNVCLLPKKMM